MPAPTTTPALRRHKRSGNAYAYFNRQQVWFGPFDDPRTHQAFSEYLARWEASGRRPLNVEDVTMLRVVDLVARYLEHAEVYYRRQDGSSTGTAEAIRYAVRPLLALFATTMAAEFTVSALKLVREHMIESGLARKTINDRIYRVVHAFRWAAEEALIPASVYHSLRVLRPLKAGRSKARETAGITAVTRDQVEAVLPYVSRPVGAMIELQWWSGMRPGEVVQLRSMDLDRDSTPWFYRPESHKTAHHGRERTIALGPKARAVLEPFLLRVPPLAPEQQLFSPKDAEAERNRDRRDERKTPLYPSHVRANERRRRSRGERTLGAAYTVTSYRRAVVRACERAAVERWTPHCLRHAAATRIRSELDLEAARVALGHASTSMAEHYAVLDTMKAAKIMEQLG